MACGIAAALFVMHGCGPKDPGPILPPVSDQHSDIAEDGTIYIAHLENGKQSRLQAALDEGRAVPVRYENRTLTIIEDCTLSPGSYRYYHTDWIENKRMVLNATSIEAAFPVKVVDLEARVKTGKQMIEFTGFRGQRSFGSVVTSAAGPGCKNVTHYVDSVQVGTYVRFFGQNVTVAARATVEEAFKVGFETEHQLTDRHALGTPSTCPSGKPGDSSPPDGCGVPLIAKLNEFSSASVAVCTVGLGKDFQVDPKAGVPIGTCAIGAGRVHAAISGTIEIKCDHSNTDWCDSSPRDWKFIVRIGGVEVPVQHSDNNPAGNKEIVKAWVLAHHAISSPSAPINIGAANPRVEIEGIECQIANSKSKTCTFRHDFAVELRRAD